MYKYTRGVCDDRFLPCERGRRRNPKYGTKRPLCDGHSRERSVSTRNVLRKFPVSRPYGKSVIVTGADVWKHFRRRFEHD